MVWLYPLAFDAPGSPSPRPRLAIGARHETYRRLNGRMGLGYRHRPTGLDSVAMNKQEIPSALVGWTTVLAALIWVLPWLLAGIDTL